MVLHLLHSSFIFSSNLRPSGQFLILRQYLYKIMIMIWTLLTWIQRCLTTMQWRSRSKTTSTWSSSLTPLVRRTTTGGLDEFQYCNILFAGCVWSRTPTQTSSWSASASSTLTRTTTWGRSGFPRSRYYSLLPWIIDSKYLNSLLDNIIISRPTGERLPSPSSSSALRWTSGQTRQR